MEGAADVLMVPDPTTFRTLPWAPGTPAGCCATSTFADGRPVPFCDPPALSSGVLRTGLAERGYDFMAGLEVEFHVFKLETTRGCNRTRSTQHGPAGRWPIDVSLLSPGYQYLTEQRYDLIEPVVDILRSRRRQALGLPLRTMEVRAGARASSNSPSDRRGRPGPCRQHGPVSQRGEARSRGGTAIHATFMSRPKHRQYGHRRAAGTCTSR